MAEVAPKPANDDVFHAHGISPSTRVIVVASGKGGVGKSTVAVNLATTLARTFSVGLLDADIYGFSVPSMIGVDQVPEVVHHHELVPPAAHGVKVMSMGYFLNEDQALQWRGPMLGKALRQMLTDVHWRGPEFLIIDTPPGTGDVAMTIAELFSHAQTLVVTTPAKASQRVAIRSGAMALENKQQLIGVVENMVDEGELFGVGGAEEIASALGTDVIGSIPLSFALRNDADNNEPTVATKSDTNVVNAFEALAEKIVQTLPTKRMRSELKIS